MDDTSSNTADQQAATGTATATTSVSESIGIEHREAYGTAKTENLRDSGAFRVILPGFVVLLCLALFAIPLIILVPLFVNSLDSSAATHYVGWLFIVMAIIDLAVATLLIRGLLKIFMTQADNY
ncbi:MAG: hypothetical protein WCD86_06735 [Ktedonobacteraceae bacterium]